MRICRTVHSISSDFCFRHLIWHLFFQFLMAKTFLILINYCRNVLKLLSQPDRSRVTIHLYSSIRMLRLQFKLLLQQFLSFFPYHPFLELSLNLSFNFLCDLCKFLGNMFLTDVRFKHISIPFQNSLRLN